MKPNKIENKRVLVACLPDPSENPRPFRAVWLLGIMGFDVWVMSPNFRFAIPNVSGHLPLNVSGREDYLWKVYRKIISIFRNLLTHMNFGHYIADEIHIWLLGAKSHLERIRNGEFDLIIVEDLELLSWLIEKKHTRTKVVFDAREYYPLEFEASLEFKLINRFAQINRLARALPKVDGFYTVCERLAQEYEAQFNQRPVVIRSTPFFATQHSSKQVTCPIKMVHHGNANSDRGLEKMIDVVKRLDDRFTLDFYLVGNQNNINALKEYSKNCIRIRFKEPVDFNDLNKMLSLYDLGLYLLQPTGFNTRFALPNKFFEFIQAGLGVVVGPSPEMARLVNQYSCGAVSEGFHVDSMVALLENLSASEIENYKAAARLAAEELCWEVESKKLSTLINDVLAHCEGFG